MAAYAMAAYAIAGIQGVSDEAGMAQYRAGVGQSMAAYGGKLLAAAPGECAEGEWRPLVGVVIEFPDIAALKGWYESEGYRELRALRQRSAQTDILFVDGV